MDKPISMSVKDWLIRKMSLSMMIPERTIEMVVNHQMESALKAMEGNANSVEFSGWGKFSFNVKKANFKMKKYLALKKAYEAIIANPEETDERKRKSEARLPNLFKDIEMLKAKLNDNCDEYKPDSGGVEK